MSKATVFYLISSKFFVDRFFFLFFGNLIFFPHTPNKDPPACYLLVFDLLDLITGFLDFLDLKTGFSDRKKIS